MKFSRHSVRLRGVRSRVVGSRGKAARKRPSRLQLELLEARTLLSVSGFHTDRVLFPAAGGGSNGYTPAQIRQAYGFNNILFGSTAADGRGQTIAIVDAYNDPNIVSDLHTFDQAFGIADPPSFRVVNQTGGANLPGTDPSQGWEGEIALDVEWAHAIAPGANILLVEANSSFDSDLFAAVDYARHQAGVSVISMSWGSDDNAANAQYDQTLSQQYLVTPAGHAGVTFVAATGDQGLTGFPATSPNVLAVGGTNLYLTSNGTITSETAWTPSSSGGVTWSGGGGNSSEFPGRHTPDVSYNAGLGVQVYDTFGPDHGWVSIGGTSAGAPQWAALIAIADQGRAINHLASLDSTTQTIAALYQFSAADFHDITTGSTQFHAAGPGYDLATGRGTPVADRLIADLSGWTNGGTTTPTQPTAPAAPGSFAVQAFSSTQATLSWSLSAGADGYKVYEMIGGQAVLMGTYGASAATASVGNLAPSSTVSFQVVAYNSAGSAATSWVQLAMPSAAIAAPQNVQVVATSTTTAQLSWSASTGAAGYLIYWKNGNRTVQIGNVGPGTTSVSIRGLAPGSTNSFSVKAYSVGATAASGWVSVVMPNPVVLAAPQNVVAVSTSSTTAKVSWSASAGATGYLVYWWNGRRSALIGNFGAGTTSVNVQGITASSVNYFAVAAYNNTSSAASAWVALTAQSAGASNHGNRASLSAFDQAFARFALASSWREF